MSDEELKDRVEALEREVRELRQHLGDLAVRESDGSPSRRLDTVADEKAVESTEPARPEDPAAADRVSTDSTPAAQGRARDGRSAVSDATFTDDALTGVIAKIGIALVLLGVGFLLKYSYEQGWLAEPVRVGLGLLTGTILLAGGVHQRRANDTLSAAMLGGAVAVYYGSIFAAYSLYELIPWSVAIASMIGTTMLGFALSVTQDRSALASIAAAGGLATPFLLDSPDGGPQLLSAYTMVVLMGTTTIYLMRGWRSLLVTAGLGGLAVMVATAFAVEAPRGVTMLALVVIATFTSVAAASLAPALREMFRGEPLGSVEQAMALFAPMAVIGVFEVLSDDSSGLLVGLVAGLAIVYFAVNTRTEEDSGSYLAAAIALAVAAVGIALGVEPLAMAMVGLGVGANVVGSRDSGSVRALGYASLAALGVWTLMLLFPPPSEPPFLDGEGLQMVFATAGVLFVGMTYDDDPARWNHLYVATLAGMVTVVHQLSAVSGGEGIATLIWGVFALGILVLGLSRDHSKMQVLGLVVILLTAGKLLVFDLETVATIWRVALFMVFGSALLYISYLVPRWQASRSQDIQSEP